MRMLSVNRDIMIRTAALISVWLFFTAQGARAGDVTLAANAVLNNFLLISAFFLDGLANAAEQLCGRAYGARDRAAFSGAVRLVMLWGFGFALAVTAVFALLGPALIDVMTASADVRHGARDYLWFVALSPLLAVFAFGYDGVYIGATWARDMRNLMMLSLLIFLGRLAGAALVRQCRAVGRAAGALCRARRVAGAALSGDAARLVPLSLRRNLRPMQLQFVGCGDALGSGGRYNTCFHVTGERVNFLIDCGASSLPALKRLGHRPRRYRPHPDHAFSRRSFRAACRSCCWMRSSRAAPGRW